MNQHAVFAPVKKTNLIRESFTHVRLEPSGQRRSAAETCVIEQVIDDFGPVTVAIADLQRFGIALTIDAV